MERFLEEVARVLHLKVSLLLEFCSVFTSCLQKHMVYEKGKDDSYINISVPMDLEGIIFYIQLHAAINYLW